MADYGLFEDEANVVLALLRANPLLTVYPAASLGSIVVPVGAARPYVGVRFAASRPSGGRLDHRSTRMSVRAYLYCVADTSESARGVADLVAQTLLDVRPDVAGRSCTPIRHELSRDAEPREDESTNTLLVTITEVYRFDSLPGADGS